MSGSLREPGRVLGGRYHLRERIDEGGAGEVWLARDEVLGRDVAVKLLGSGADPAFRERFTDEARRAAVVSHPNVVTVFDQGQDGSDAFMVMEHVRGRTLRDVVAERGALAPIETARIVAQVADALDAAHAAGVIHCDVKPANIIVDERGTAKLTDFGIARAARDVPELELVATPRYIAPERIEGRPPTAASDVYGLGLVAYELLAGHSPSEGLDTDDLLRERLEGPPPSLRGLPGVSPDVDIVVAKALARDVSRRYASAGTFARDLIAAARGERTATMPVTPPPPRPLRRGGRRPDSAVAVLAVFAVLAVLLALILLVMNFPQVPSIGGPAASPTATAAVAPNVVGKSVEDAARILLAAGFRGSPDAGRISWTTTTAPGTACTVVSQQPPANSPYRRGDVASLVLVAPARGSC